MTWRSNYGLLNQLRTLRKAGALYMQVLMLTPSPGSKWYEDTYFSGLAFERVGGKEIEPYSVLPGTVLPVTIPPLKLLNQALDWRRLPRRRKALA